MFEVLAAKWKWGTSRQPWLEGSSVVTDDPRYDMARSFEAESQVCLAEACAQIMVRFGRRYGLQGFEADWEREGDRVWVWTEARSAALGLCVSNKSRFLTPEEKAGRVPFKILNPYTILLAWNTKRVGWDEERAIRAALSEVFECQLVPLPRRYFA